MLDKIRNLFSDNSDEAPMSVNDYFYYNPDILVNRLNTVSRLCAEIEMTDDEYTKDVLKRSVDVVFQTIYYQLETETAEQEFEAYGQTTH
jgi:hypothetical protein